MLFEKLLSQFRYFAADVPLAVAFDFLFGEADHPVAEPAVHGAFVDHPVGGAFEQRVGLEFEVVVDVDAQFLDEGADDALEKLVDRHDGETAVVVQNLRAGLDGAVADRLRGEIQFLFQQGEVPAPSFGQRVEFGDDALFHLFGGLVGERDGQNVTVRARRGDHVANVFIGQPIGFPRSGRGFQDFYFSHVTKGSSVR